MTPQSTISRAAKSPVAMVTLMAVLAALASPISPHPDLDEVTTIDRPWLLESDFDADPALHATEGQVVVLELEERGDGQGVLRENTIRFLVEKERLFAFCIPVDDPHLVRLRLERGAGFGSAKREAKAEQRRQHGRTVLT
jgi:hypothetical protein